MINAMLTTCTAVSDSLHANTPIKAIVAVPTPDQIAYETLMSIFLTAIVISPNESPYKTNSNTDGNVRVKPCDSFIDTVPAISRTIAPASASQYSIVAPRVLGRRSPDRAQQKKRDYQHIANRCGSTDVTVERHRARRVTGLDHPLAGD